jgi:ATP-dependent RNA helicase DeaD
LLSNADVIRRPEQALPSFEDLHLEPTIATTLTQLGWSPDHPAAREVTPTVARGHNLVAATPPIPEYAAPALAAVLTRVQHEGLALVVVPQSQLEEWAGLVHRLAHQTGARVQVGRGTARAMRQLHAGSLDCLLTTAESALTLVTRSSLRMDSVSSFVLAWPESLDAEESITPLMQDLPKEAQRVIYSSEPERIGALVERYARKALTIDVAGPFVGVAAPVRTVNTAWSARIQSLAALVELLDPASLAIWTVDRRYHAAIAEAVAAGEPEVHLVIDAVPQASTIIAFDLPSLDGLRQMLSSGEVVLLVPPGTETYVARLAAQRRPIQLPGWTDMVGSTHSAHRATIVKEMETGSIDRALHTLSPLFERYEASAVAAALYQLWTRAIQRAPPAPAESPIITKVYVGVGKKDGANPNELVAVLTKELGVDRSKIGRIELRDSYSLIEIPANEAEQVAAGLNGMTIRRRRVTARVDRGSTRQGRIDGKAGTRPQPTRRR